MSVAEIRSEQINELATALAKAQAVLEGANKTKVNPAFKSKYADLASVWDSARDPLSNNGLSVVQIPQETESGMVLITMLMHSSGQWISSRYPIKPVKADPQGYGSAISYARRYSLMAMVGIAPEEDDGAAASGHGTANNNGARPDYRRQQEEHQAAVTKVEELRRSIAAALEDVFGIEGLDDVWAKNRNAIASAKEVDETLWNRINDLFRSKKAEILKPKIVEPRVEPPVEQSQSKQAAPPPIDPPWAIDVPKLPGGDHVWGAFVDEMIRVISTIPDEAWGAEFVELNKAQVAALSKVAGTVRNVDGHLQTGKEAARQIREAMQRRFDELVPQAAE